jgi:hypothetical protein
MTQKEIKARLKKIEQLRKSTWRCTDPDYLALMKEAKVIEEKWQKKQQGLREDLETERRCLESDLKALKEKGELKIPDHIKKWLKQYSEGVDWGYGGLKIRWISPDEKWAIITNGGGTAGTGTPMGTGGYYYAEVSHFLGKITDRGSYNNRYAEVEGGRLTNEIKEKLIAAIPKIEAGEDIRYLIKKEL